MANPLWLFGLDVLQLCFSLLGWFKLYWIDKFARQLVASHKIDHCV